MIGTIELQKEMEAVAIGVAKDKSFADLEKAIRQGRFDETVYGNAVIKIYFIPVRDKIQEYLDTPLLTGHSGRTRKYLEIHSSSANELAYVTLQTVVRSLSKYNNSMLLATLASDIMQNLRIIKLFNSVGESNPKLVSYLGSEYRRASARRKTKLMAKHMESFAEDDKDNSIYATKAGALLIDLIMLSGCNLLEIAKRWNRRVNKHPVYKISFSDEVLEALADSYYVSPSVASFPPMVVEPLDWVSMKEGGYLSKNYNFMKLKNKQQRASIKEHELQKAMGVINKAQKTKWRVNKRIADVIYDIFEDNIIDPTSPPEVPTLYGGIPTSTIIEAVDIIEPYGYYPDNPTLAEKKEWAIWNKKREGIQIGLDAENGRRLQYLMTMGMMQKVIDYDYFYYVYQLDYRGRVYPITDFFNPQSKGYVKAMLEFGEGHHLDDTGVKWLKIHSANTYGLDKEPFSERIDWFQENRTNMLEAAEDPRGTLGYWTKADSPFEFLASCMALQDHVQGRKVYLPIQLDAVNSGVQMYSGLLRDKEGAQSTCVIGPDRSDLYQEVADRVEHKLTSGNYPPICTYMDKEGGETTVSTKVEAASLKGNFTRKLTKPNVMTVPYSITMRGMKLQNWDIMDEMRLNGKDFWKGEPWVVNYLWTELTHEAIFEIVKGARAGQTYLKEVAKLLDTQALWHTPIYNIPVLQPAYKDNVFRVATVLGKLSLVERTNELKRQKQLSSIAANFIHSIDSTILLYVVDKISGDIGMIHDCFLVHPNLGEEVRNKYKEGYVEVMRADPLKMFSEELDKDGVVEIPYVGDLELDEVYDSEYIIS